MAHATNFPSSAGAQQNAPFLPTADSNFESEKAYVPLCFSRISPDCHYCCGCVGHCVGYTMSSRKMKWSCAEQQTMELQLLPAMPCRASPRIFPSQSDIATNALLPWQLSFNGSCGSEGDDSAVSARQCWRRFFVRAWHLAEAKWPHALTLLVTLTAAKVAGGNSCGSANGKMMLHMLMVCWCGCKWNSRNLLNRTVDAHALTFKQPCYNWGRIL